MTFITSHFNTGVIFKRVSTNTVYKSNKQYIICFKNTAIVKITECDRIYPLLALFPLNTLT